MRRELTCVKNLLSNENSKLGKSVFSFSLPAGKSCPGKSGPCEACYATKGHYNRGSVQDKYEHLHKWAKTDPQSLADALVAEILARGIEDVRIHASGDFFSVAYVEMWRDVVRRTPGVRYYTYTRSWRLEPLALALESLVNEFNGRFRLWYSCDQETGIPEERPNGIGVAYMALDDDDRPTVDLSKDDIIFRVQRKTVLKRVGLTLVCPKEQGRDLPNVTCGTCRLCLPVVPV